MIKQKKKYKFVRFEIHEQYVLISDLSHARKDISMFKEVDNYIGFDIHIMNRTFFGEIESHCSDGRLLLDMLDFLTQNEN